MQPTFIFLSFLLLLYRLSLTLATPTPPLIPILDSIINTTITASTLNSPPPQALMTTIHSQECLDVNQGELLCCEGMVDGDQPVVLWAAELFDLRLNADSVNGLGCEFFFSWFFFEFFVIWTTWGMERGRKADGV
ncbi:hypothetical protein OCU04_010981 [Sclerotinia nivalis]|uniref:Hydrophobin n=1 Tax=Sclerotinia nivalis TaxID=352851 RepID=A0A9X0AGT5_9HELO|nr:hypothetical protein OCU04_010981 [Sclerotinia nivalis]